jgi:RNA polymerase sigma factor (sigma-70 family)
MSTMIASNRIRPVPFLEPLSDEKLVAQAKLGSEPAFTELWSRHGERARNVVWRITRNREDAEDILQEAYLKSYLHLVSFNGESQFSTWLNRIAINAALMLLRKRRNHPEIFFENNDPDSSAPAMDFPDRSESIEAWFFRSECIQQLRMAMQELPSSLRYVFELQNCDELPLEEIARRTGITVAAVKSRLVRARATLRELTTTGRGRKGARRMHRRPKEMSRAALPAC